MSRYKGTDGLIKALNKIDEVVNSPSALEKQRTFLSNEFIKLNNKYVTYQTKELRQSIVRNTDYKKAHIKAVTPYARYIYYGETKDGKPLKYSKPNAKPEFFMYTWEHHKDDLEEMYIEYEQKELDKKI